VKHYAAPWSKSLIIISALVSIGCVAIAIVSLRSGSPGRALFPLALIFGALLFIVRGYTITRDAILVHRLFWTTRLPLSGLQSAEVAPDAMRGGIRLFGNGGLFSITGFFRNKMLGTYRAFVTDPHRTVVLQFAKRAVVLSPSPPESFVEEIRVAAHAV
jgi:hypothetical protein